MKTNKIPERIKVKGAIYKLAEHFKGGFSTKVYDSGVFQNYIKSGSPSGYIGSSSRTNKWDKIVEAILSKQGLGPNGIASWLTSTSGRHFMDDVTKTMPESEFKKRANNYLVNAAHDVAVWSHPDHVGSMESSGKIREHLHGLFSEKK